ncbi:MAG: RsmE family RNA methyltransferase, partial [Wujia sp.]
MHRFFVDKGCLSAAEENIVIIGEDVNHIKNVLRLKAGEDILISDGEGTDYQCTIRHIGTDNVVADIVDVFKNSAELPVKITLFQGMPKADKLELIIQKAVEVGVTEIVPVITKR